MLSEAGLRLTSTNAKDSTFSKLNARLTFGQSYERRINILAPYFMLVF